MEAILRSLHELDQYGYERSIFNFYIKNENDKKLERLLPELQNRIEQTDSWDQLWDRTRLSGPLLDRFKSSVRGVHLCLVDKTHILRNPEYLTEGPKITKIDHDGLCHFEPIGHKSYDNMIQVYQTGQCSDLSGLIQWITREKNPIISYVKTINKKKRTRFTELGKAVLHKPHTVNFSGILSNEFQDDQVTTLSDQTPWIKEYKISLRLQASGDKIMSGGRTGLSQSVDITLQNKTCLILFKNGTFHALLSKTKDETFIEFLNLIVQVLEFVCLFQIMFIPETDPRIFEYGKLIQSLDRTDPEQIMKALSLNDYPTYPLSGVSMGILNVINVKMKMPEDFFILLKETNDCKQIKLYKPDYINFVVIKNNEELKKLIEYFHSLLEKVKKIYKQKRSNPLFGQVPEVE